jgi:energy-coupling factor transporter ATP-binding protein EcfA2
MIVIDGPDGSGKSTLVEYIKKNSSLELVKPFYPKQDQLSYYLHSPAHYAPFYLERYYTSELVYPQFKEGRDKMQPWHHYLIEAGMMPFAPVILYLRPDRETILNNLQIRGDDYIHLEEIDQMLYFYDEVMENTYFPVFTYNYKENNINTLLELVESTHKSRQEKAQPLQKFLSSGNYYEEGCIMFVGDMPSNYSIGKGFIRAFISNTGSSEYFHRCLFDAGIYPTNQMPYFTNWNKCEGNDKLNMKALDEELLIVKPRKVIFLGESIRKKAAMGEFISHPAYIKRFKPTQYKEYLQEIKEKMEI